MAEATPLKGRTSPRRIGWQRPLHQRMGHHPGGPDGRVHSTEGRDATKEDRLAEDTPLKDFQRILFEMTWSEIILKDGMPECTNEYP